MAGPAFQGPGVGRGLVESLADAAVALFRAVEAFIIRHLTNALRAPVPAGEDWETVKLRAAGRLRALIDGELAAMEEPLRQAVHRALTEAWQRGSNAAIAEMLGLTDEEAARLRQEQPGVDAIARLVAALLGVLTGTRLPIVRWADDAYRTVITAAAADVLGGERTRLQAAQGAWEKLLDQGITGFTDRAGRRWALAAYTEMAVRTATAQAAVEGHMDRLHALGVDLVIVSDAPQECERCRPWEGRVLARTGPAGARTVEVEHATRDGEVVKVQAAGTVHEAVAAGLLHLGPELPAQPQHVPTWRDQARQAAHGRSTG